MGEITPKIKKLAGYIKANPDDSFSKFALALEFLKIDEIRRARRLFESIYQNDPDYVGVYYHLGKLYASVEEADKARTTFQEGIEKARSAGDQHAASELQTALLELEMNEE